MVGPGVWVFIIIIFLTRGLAGAIWGKPGEYQHLLWRSHTRWILVFHGKILILRVIREKKKREKVSFHLYINIYI